MWYSIRPSHNLWHFVIIYRFSLSQIVNLDIKVHKLWDLLHNLWAFTICEMHFFTICEILKTNLTNCELIWRIFTICEIFYPSITICGLISTSESRHQLYLLLHHSGSGLRPWSPGDCRWQQRPTAMAAGSNLAIVGGSKGQGWRLAYPKGISAIKEQMLEVALMQPLSLKPDRSFSPWHVT